MEDGNFQRAKNLLLGAVDTVIAIAAKERSAQGGGQGSSRSAQGGGQGSSRSAQGGGHGLSSLSLQFPTQPRATPTAHSSIEEHKRLFGHQPSKGTRKKGRTRGGLTAGRRKGKTTWRKDCICLRDSQQAWRPSPEEKIELARMGLGLKEVVFRNDGDAESIHSAIMDKFPVLEQCGGYTFLRLTENSHNMMEIESPDSGMTVGYLKDILNQAKLYVRPLQKDITEDDMKPFVVPEDEVIEPEEFCQQCDALLPLSQLRKHVASCQKMKTTPRDRDHGSEGVQPSRANASGNARSDEMEVWGARDSLIAPPVKRQRVGDPPGSEPKAPHVPPETVQVLQLYPSPVHDPPSSPIAPSPEPLSPILEQRQYGSTTYESFINLISDDDAEWEKDPAVQSILHQSASNMTAGDSDLELTTEDVIQWHRKEVLHHDKQNTFRITVRRGHILDDTLASIRSGFDEKKHIRVTFLGEAAVDEGGPRREFFMLLMGAIANNSSLLDGPPDRRVLRHNTSAFQDDLYLYVGKMIALSILHGGPGPVFFAPVVVDYLFGGISMVKPSIEDVPDELLQSRIRKLANTINERDFKQLMSSEEYEFRYTCGVSKPLARIPFSDKEKVISAMCLHYSVLFSLAELEQLRRGLPPEFKISSGYIQDLFVPVFSPKGSNKREVEEAIMMMWIRFLQYLEAQGNQGSPNLSDVMVFLTGCDTPPPLGFGDVNATMRFTESDGLPTVSTCSLTLRFPLDFQTDFEEFKEKMAFAILGSHGFFGTV